MELVLDVCLALMVVALLVNLLTTEILVLTASCSRSKRNFEKMAVATLEPGFARILNLALVGPEETHSLLSVVVYLVIAKSLVPHALARTLGSRVSCPLESEVFWGCVLTDGGLLPATGAATGVPLAAIPGRRWLPRRLILRRSTRRGRALPAALARQRRENAHTALQTQASLLGY